MGKSVAAKLLEEHLVSGKPRAGEEVAIRIDQTLTQDATGTMAYLQFEALGLPRVRTELSVSYVDHNMLQTGFENADDHRYLQTVAARYGLWFSRPGNGICHQVHLERFGVPGRTLLGSDSHTPTGGGIGMLAVGAGGLDVALAMAGRPFHLVYPQIVEVSLAGKLPPFVSAKDIILELLRRLTVKGGVGRIFEFTGPAVAALSVPERATITNMGTELGATTSVFPSDGVTRAFLSLQKREKSWREILPDRDAAYDERVDIDLSKLSPLAACPHMPDRVVPVRELAGQPVHQVAMGSCTNSSLLDVFTIAAMLDGKRVHRDVTASLSPGSRQVVRNAVAAVAKIVEAGVRVLECACGPCIGMGFSPGSGQTTVRTFNRNFKGRSGTKDAGIYLVSPQTAVACALTGVFTDPRELGIPAPKAALPKRLLLDDSMIVPPGEEKVEVVRGPNIRPLPEMGPLPDSLEGRIVLRVGDNVTTDDIMPAGAKILPLRSNIPAISRHVFEAVDAGFPERAKAAGTAVVVGGENYGQGSSREHAALAPRALGVRAVVAKSFARIHRANLVNFGILPLELADPADYERFPAEGAVTIDTTDLEGGAVTVTIGEGGDTVRARCPLTTREIGIVRAGGALAHARRAVAGGGRS